MRSGFRSLTGKGILDRDPGADRARNRIERRMERALVRALYTVMRRVVRRARRDGLAVLGDNQFWAWSEELLGKAVQPGLEEAAMLGLQAGMELLGWTGRKQVSAGIDWALVNAWALEWSRGHRFQLIRGLTSTNRRALSRMLGDWIEAGEPLRELERRMVPMFGRTRAQLVSSTEVTRAYALGTQYLVDHSGLDVHPARELPPKHPRCRCFLTVKRRADGSYVYIWNTVRDSRVCEECAALEGQELV